MAVSIPIFTSQLAKARLATNQANARAAYAASAAQLLLDESTTSTAKNYDYTVSSGEVSVGTTAASGHTAIADWRTTDNIGVAVGSTLAETWTVSFDANGKLVGISGSAS